MLYKVLEKNAADLVTHVFELPDRQQFPYHNLLHTQKVVEYADEIALFYNLDEKDACVLRIAAWFHDIGHVYGNMDGHEEKSVQIMSNFLETDDGKALIPQVAGCIRATKLGAMPKTLSEKIICDADTYHFGTRYFRETEFLIKKEMEIRKDKKLTHWHEGSLQLLENHVFFTEYCQLLLRKGKQENIGWLKSLIQSGQE